MNTETFKNTLLAKRSELSGAQLNRDEIQVERRPDLLDDVQQNAERDLAIASFNRHWATIRAIDEALERIASGAYGICAKCDEDIAARRLDAIPWAVLCRDCQEKKDEAMKRGESDDIDFGLAA